MENSAYLALPLFAGLAAGDIPAALAALDALCRPFAKGETLLEAGQRGAPMGVVLAGRVLIEHLDLWGNRTLLGRAAEGELFAETYAFLPDQPMLVSVVAAERGEALFLDPGPCPPGRTARSGGAGPRAGCRSRCRLPPAASGPRRAGSAA